nr:EOG090X078K [Lepidurus arcticus]
MKPLRNRRTASIFATSKLSNPFAARSSDAVRIATNRGDGPLAPSRLAVSSSTAASGSSSLGFGAFGQGHAREKDKLVLRPSLFGTASSSSSSSNGNSPSSSGKSFVLKPPTFNPFAKEVDSVDDIENGKGTSSASGRPMFGSAAGFLSTSVTVTTSSAVAAAVAAALDSTAPAAAGEDGASVSSSVRVQPTTSVFPSLTTNATTVKPPTLTTSSAGGAFVFGQNLSARVENPSTSTADYLPPTEPLTNGSTGLFNLPPTHERNGESPDAKATKSLTESAKEMEESRAAKRRYDEVAVVTGEEDESNVLQVSCKLYAFDKGNWAERGAGALRLNDKSGSSTNLQSRLVMRAQGTLRLILNTKLWPEMKLEKVSTKSIRITAMDEDKVKIFLIMASPKDTEVLFHALEWRVATMTSQQQQRNAMDDSEEAGNEANSEDKTTVEGVESKRRKSAS